MTEKAQVGLIGLGVMGASLARNIARSFKTVVYNRTKEVTEEYINEFGSENLIASYTPQEFVESIESPRKIFVMVSAGPAFDKVAESLEPYLEEGDILIDNGNSFYKDSIRRNKELKEKGLRFVGCGVSGGERGALEGPSLMPGCDADTWKDMKPVFEAIAAKDFSGGPCVTHVGADGAGHYVKMVHNGIEYGIMQIIAEGYQILRTQFNQTPEQISKIFKKYNSGKLESFLIEIAAEIFGRKDEFEEGFLIDYILDKAGNKGTGKWTSMEALDRGVTLSTITAAVYARYVSSNKDLRTSLSDKINTTSDSESNIELSQFIKNLENAIYLATISSFAQGYDLIQVAAKEQDWNVNLAEVSRIWEGGCIIRAKLLSELHGAFAENNDVHVFEIESIQKIINDGFGDLKEVVKLATEGGVAIPALSASLNYIVSMSEQRLSANVIQGLRDRFGSHTYERTDREGVFHTDWS